ncbi:MAG: metallophosphoesterase family protein [Bauldia sp.]
MPPGLRVYAFGDLHGRADLAARLAAAIDADVAANPIPKTLVIGLGDYIDRGPNSFEVIATLLSIAVRYRAAFIKGNHEAMLLDFLQRPLAAGPGWIDMGGAEFLQSYGVRAGVRVGRGEELERMRSELAARLPPEHLLFFSRLSLSQIVGDYFFVHAGVRPGVALSEQRERDLLWIRTGFADRDAPFEKIVVHGHTPTKEPFDGRHRINLDTGAYATGRLTCLALEGEARRFLEITA